MMHSNVVSSILHAAPDAVHTYRKNRVLERMRKGNKHVFTAVDLMTGVHDLLDAEVKDTFSMKFNECVVLYFSFA